VRRGTPEHYLTTPDGQLALLVLIFTLEAQVKVPFQTLLTHGVSNDHQSRS
jgi:hypothetical protein